jgi:hypothetical protein
MISIINTLPDDRSEDELVEELLTRLMLERSREQFERGEYVDHERVKRELLNG